MIPLREWAEKNGLRLPTVASQFARGAIEGAQLVDGKRMVPENAPVPPMKAPKPVVTVPGMITVADWAHARRITNSKDARDKLGDHVTVVNGVYMIPADLPDTPPGTIPLSEWAERNGLTTPYADHLVRTGEIEAVRWLGVRYVKADLIRVRKRIAPQKNGQAENS